MNSERLHRTFRDVMQAAGGMISSTSNGRPVTRGRRRGIASFAGNLASNAPFLGGGKRDTSVLRGSLAGLASGVTTVMQNRKAPPRARHGAAWMILTIAGYVVGGIVAGLVYRQMRKPMDPIHPVIEE